MSRAGMGLGGTARSPEEVLVLKRMGLQFAEIPIRDPESFLSTVDQYKESRKRSGLFYLCHGIQEGDPNDAVALETVYLPKLDQILSIMPELGMTLLTLHLWLDPRFVKEKVIRFKINLLREIIGRARKKGIAVAVENLSESAEDMVEAFEALPLLGLTLDLGHAQLLRKENTSFGFMEKYPGRIRHVHIHDNLGGDSPKDDLHLPVGKGIIDFPKILAKLEETGYRGTITMELRPQQIRENLPLVRSLLRL